MVFTCFRSAPNYPNLKPFESLLMYLETFGCITNNINVLWSVYRPSDLLRSRRLMEHLWYHRELSLPLSDRNPWVELKSLACFHISRWSPDFFFQASYTIAEIEFTTATIILYSQWHSSVSSRASLGSQTIDTNLLTNIIRRMLITCS